MYMCVCVNEYYLVLKKNVLKNFRKISVLTKYNIYLDNTYHVSVCIEYNIWKRGQERLNIRG